MTWTYDEEGLLICLSQEDESESEVLGYPAPCVRDCHAMESGRTGQVSKRR